MAYWRADIDKYDLIIFLLYIIQVMFKEKLLRAITQLPQKSLDELALLDNGSFMAIKDYVNTIKHYCPIKKGNSIFETVEL